MAAPDHAQRPFRRFFLHPRGRPHMPVWNGGPAALATPGPPPEPRHLGRSAGLVDEDQLFGVEVELAVEPGLPRFEDVGTLLLRRMRGLFLNVRPCRSRKVQTAVIPIVTFRSRAKRSAISASEMSFVPPSTSPRMKAECGSSREPRDLP